MQHAGPGSATLVIGDIVQHALQLARQPLFPGWKRASCISAAPDATNVVACRFDARAFLLQD
jgi:hypothetical protein